MFQHLKRLFKHSVVYGLSETVSRGTGFILVFIYTHILTKDELGVRTLLYGAAAFIGLFYSLGLDNAFLRYFMDREYQKKKEDVLSTAFTFTMIIGIVFLVIALFFDSFISQLIAKSDSYQYLVRLLFITLIFDTVVVYPTLILRAENRLLYYSLVAVARFVLFIALNVLLVVFMGRGLDGIFEANLIVVVVIALMLSPVYRTYLSRYMTVKTLKRMLAFGVPTIFTLLAMRIVDTSDRFLIAYLLGERGTAELGGYAVAYTLGMAGIMVFVNSFRLAWQPFFLSVKDDSGAQVMFARVATYYAMFIGMVFLGITLFRKEIFALYAPAPEYPLHLAGLLPFVSFAYVLDGFYLIMLAGIFIREKTKYLPLATAIGAFLNFSLNFLMIPYFGVYGAAYTTIVAYIAMVVVLYILSKRIYRVEYEFGRLSVVFLLTMFIALIPEFIAPESHISGILFRGLLLLVPPVVYLTSGFLRPEEYSILMRRGKTE